MQIIKIAYSAVNARLIDAPKEAKLLIQQALSYTVDGFSHMGKGGWDGKATFFRFGDASFPRGFVALVHSTLIRAGYKVSLLRKPLPAPLGSEDAKVDDFPKAERYDYQDQVVQKLLSHGQIIAQVATGGGKSRISKLCVARIKRKTLFLTTRGILMYQMAKSFKYLSKQVGIIGDGTYDPAPWIDCALVQTIAAKLKNPETREETLALLATYEFVILEEAHEASGNSFYDIMECCKNAHYRLALTATPFMKGSEEANMRLMAVSGPVAIQVSEALLIERGILAKPYFKFANLPEHTKPAKLYNTTPWQRAYAEGIVGHEYRNKLITAEALRGRLYGLSTMVLVGRKDHGKKLEAMMKKAGLRVAFIFGENNQDERQASLKKLADAKIDVLIGSTILDVGVDVPAVGMVILAGAGKAEVALRQRIGRGLREKKGGLPNVAFVIDFCDTQNSHLRAHYHQRRAIIEQTPGFAENVVNDFDFAALGFKRQEPKAA